VTIRWTGSATERVMSCPPSAALPGVYGDSSNHADDGHIMHEFLYAGATRGRAEAFEHVARHLTPDLRARCERVNLAKLASVGRIVEAEVAYAYDVATGSARILGRNLGRAYAVNDTEIPTTTDLEIVAPDGVPVLLDAKTGWRNVATDTPQLRFHALACMAARGVDRVRVGILKIDAEGNLLDPELLDVDELDAGAFAHEVRQAWAAIEAARAEIARGVIPSVTMGDHCQYCPAKPSCPAYTALARSVLANDVTTIGAAILEMSPEEGGDLWERYRAGEALLKVIGENLRELAKRRPLELPDGRTLEMVPQTQVRQVMAPTGETRTISFFVARPRGKAVRKLRVA
jgi:hypothetical protein